MKSHWTDLLITTLKDKADKIPKGWQSREEIQDEMKLEVAQTIRIIRLLLKAGKVEKKTFRVMCGSSLRPTPFYRRK